MPEIFDPFFDFRLGVEALAIVSDDPQTDFHFRKTVISRAHGFAKTGGDCFPGERLTHKPAHHAGQRCLIRSQQKKIGINGKGMANGGQAYPPHRHTGFLHGAMQRFARDMVPVSSCFIVDKQYQAIVKTTGAEMVQVPVD